MLELSHIQSGWLFCVWIALFRRSYGRITTTMSLLCFVTFVSTVRRRLIWTHVNIQLASHFSVAVDIAVPMCSLCINRRLYLIVRNKASELTSKEVSQPLFDCNLLRTLHQQKRNVILFDLFLCVGIPLLNVPLCKHRIRCKMVAAYCFSVQNSQITLFNHWDTKLRNNQAVLL